MRKERNIVFYFVFFIYCIGEIYLYNYSLEIIDGGKCVRIFVFYSCYFLVFWVKFGVF